jgi:hypothetical protein
MSKPKSLLIFCLIIILAACRTNKEERVLKGDEYFPMEIGSVHFYTVDTVLFDAFALTIDTIRSEFREEVIERIVYGPGDTAFRIELSTYDSAKFMFVPFRSFERRIKDNYAIEKMNNLEEVKLLFPIAEYKTKGSSYTWNANMFNSNQPEMVKYSSVDKTFVVTYPDNQSTKSFNNCVSIQLSKPQSGFVNKIREEVYSKNIGLVYRFTDSTDLITDPSHQHLSGIQTFIRLRQSSAQAIHPYIMYLPALYL